VAKRRAEAAKLTAKLQKAGRTITPVTIEAARRGTGVIGVTL